MVLFFQIFDKNLDFGVLFFQKNSPALRAGFYFHFFLLKIPLFSLVKSQKPEKSQKKIALRAGFIFSFSKFQLGVLLFQNLKLFFRLMVAKRGGIVNIYYTRVLQIITPPPSITAPGSFQRIFSK